jgi:xylulokinase
MSLLGIDVGTTGCKAAVFTSTGEMVAYAYQEYDILRPHAGWAELDAFEVWGKVKHVIKQVASQASRDPIVALSVSSLGEAMAPVSADRQILGPSILNFDVRGETYLPFLIGQINPEDLYRINGNILANNYSLTKLMWLRDHQSHLYQKVDKFLLWGPLIQFMLGATAVVDYSLANRTLLFDVDEHAWSPEILSASSLDASKLPRLAPSGVRIGEVDGSLAKELGLPHHVSIVTGAHDQCANALGCGVIQPGQAAFGMGTFLCITPVYQGRQDPVKMLGRGLNTEHHALPGQFVSFIYNQGGSLVKWFRDTFASEEHRQAQANGREIYADLIAEIPPGPSPVVVLPHFAVTGPPDFIADSAGMIVGLKLETTRGEILKGLLEGTAYYLKACLDNMSGTGIEATELRATGGGSKSAAWIQLCADIFNLPILRPRVSEASVLGAAIMAGVGEGIFPGYESAVNAMVSLGEQFLPDKSRHEQYLANYERYRNMWPALSSLSRG